MCSPHDQDQYDVYTYEIRFVDHNVVDNGNMWRTTGEVFYSEWKTPSAIVEGIIRKHCDLLCPVLNGANPDAEISLEASRKGNRIKGLLDCPGGLVGVDVEVK